MPLARLDANGFGDHTACASLRCSAKGRARGAQDAGGEHYWIRQSQTADIDGKGWHGQKITRRDKRIGPNPNYL
jgi:hypothetical protein